MIKKTISVSKSICILILAVAAVYQVSELWLVSLTNRNFFLYINARFPAAVPDGQNAWILPRRIISGDGSGRYTIRYSGIEDSPEWIFARFTLSRILAGGEHAGMFGYTSLHYKTSPHLTFEYSFPMHIETFANALGERRSRASAGTSLVVFTSVTLILPEDENSEWITAIFINETDEWHFNLNIGTSRNPSVDFLYEIPYISDDMLYFTRGSYGFYFVLPAYFSYNVINTHNPFQNAYGLLHLSTIRSRIEHFFDNPATIIPGPSREIYTFSNINVMVRYFQYDVLEYTSFRPIGRLAPANLVSDFSAALAFVQNDPYVINEIYLAGYEAIGGEHVFRFGHVINNFPMVMINSWPTEPGCRDPLTAPIEVTVSHGRVIRYRRIALNFNVSDDFSVFTPVSDFPISIGFPIINASVLHLKEF